MPASQRLFHSKIDLEARQQPTVERDVVSGTNSADTLTGTGNDDVISGGEGGDIINGGDGADIIYGFGASDAAGSGGAINATLIASAFDRPVFAASPPGDPNRLFVIEQHTGEINILNLNTNQVLATPFLDISGLSTGGEQGLLGLAFHPNYATNGLYYVYLTNAAGDSEVWEYTRGANPDVSSTARELVMTFDQPASNHNGGWIAFGPDGYLYIATGDGGGGGDPNNNAQNVESLLGKILRIDVNGDDFPTDSLRTYSIPTGNPFIGAAGADEVFAIGLRNPWRMSFDPSTGDLIIGDVGQNAVEEIDFVAAGTLAGRNFGWAVLEGTQIFDGTRPGNPAPNSPSLTAPIYQYGHGSGPTQGFSVTGGYVVRGPDPGGQGLYVFADFVTANVWTMRAGTTAEDVVRRNAQLVVTGGDIDQIASFAVDGQGRMYIVGLDGEIHRLTFQAGAGDAGDTLNGGNGDDALYGGIGSDLLNGGAGADLMNGGVGDDQFVVDNAGDVVSEGSSQGRDTVYTIITYTIGANVEDLATATSGAVNLFGNGLSNLIVGNAAVNGIDGAGGADTLVGGGGNDLYFVDNIADVVIEGAGEGTADVVYTSLAFYRLVDNVEQLSATAATGTYAVGNGANNLIVGGAGADALDGAGGIDTLVGGAGNDSYFVDHVADMLIEGASEGAADVVYTSLAFYALGDNVEQLSVTAATGTYAAGNGLNNLIVGNAGADALEGRGGGDVLVGNGGADSFIYNSAAEGGDAIVDFVSGVDMIRIDASGFGGGLVAGAAVTFFSSSNPVAGASAAFLYDTDDGRLFWDSDGAGGAAAILIATLSGAPTLVQSDILVGP